MPLANVKVNEVRNGLEGRKERMAKNKRTMRESSIKHSKERLPRNFPD